jgi:hypothetical protein
MRHVRALYWKNVDPTIVDLQAKVCASLGVPLVQEEHTGTLHGAWLDATLQALGPDDSILFLDIDCIPLDRDIVERAFAAAEAGRIFGVAHVAMHIDPAFLYPGPMFVALTRATWERIGSPSLLPDAKHDVGGQLMSGAQAHDVPVDMIYPNFVAVPKWPLAGHGATGMATFYDSKVFHLFRSRRDQGYRIAFEHVARCVIENRPIDYIWLHKKLNSLSVIVPRTMQRTLLEGQRSLARLGLMPRPS